MTAAKKGFLRGFSTCDQTKDESEGFPMVSRLRERNGIRIPIPSAAEVAAGATASQVF